MAAAEAIADKSPATVCNFTRIVADFAAAIGASQTGTRATFPFHRNCGSMLRLRCFNMLFVPSEVRNGAGHLRAGARHSLDARLRLQTRETLSLAIEQFPLRFIEMDASSRQTQTFQNVLFERGSGKFSPGDPVDRLTARPRVFISVCVDAAHRHFLSCLTESSGAVLQNSAPGLGVVPLQNRQLGHGCRRQFLHALCRSAAATSSRMLSIVTR